MTKVTITFEVPEESYNEYENILDEFSNNLIDIGIENFDTLEDEE